MRPKRFYQRLYFWVFVAMVLGVLNGVFFPEFAIKLQPLATAFIRLIRMMLAPIIFTMVVVGIAGMDSLKRVGRIGLKAFVYFEVMTTLALTIGWLVAKTVQPGAGMNADASKLNVSEIQKTLADARAHSDPVEFVMGFIPKTIVGAFAEGDVIQVLFISVLFGIAMAGVGESNRPVIQALDQIAKALMRMIIMIVRLAPLAVFGAMSYTISKFGFRSLHHLGELMACTYITCILFITIGFGLLLRLNGLSLWRFLIYLWDELAIIFGTASSETVFPQVMAKLENLGCSKALVGIVLPAGYSFNLDGSSIYLTMGALFIAQATKTHLTFGQELSVLVVSLLTSKGTAAVVGSTFIALAATLSAMHTIPVEGMVLILGIDWFMAQARAMTNMIGNSVATVVIARWENELDLETARKVLNGQTIELAPQTHPAAPQPSIQEARMGK
jgi:aerobic C4-dicarboxylate transport protein